MLKQKNIYIPRAPINYWYYKSLAFFYYFLAIICFVVSLKLGITLVCQGLGFN